MSPCKRIALACMSLLAAGLVPAGIAFAQQIKVTAATPASAYQGTISLDVVVAGSGFNRTANVEYLVTGTTLFSVKSKPKDPPLPTYPPARILQSFAANGGATAATSRLYMFGGDGSDGTPIGDLWSYANAGSTAATWTFVPGGSVANGTAPAGRKGAGWSCAAGLCVLAGGMSTKLYNDTWLFNESTQTWSQVTCGRRAVCPQARAFQAMAYDPVRHVHVMFGGTIWTDWLADTYTFDTSTKAWTRRTGGKAPAAREGAAAAYAPGVGVVMFGGADGSTLFNDMYVWSGTEWLPVTSTVVSDPPWPVPALHLPNMAWDPVRGALIVAKGLLTSGWVPSEDVWSVTFANSGGGWHAT